MTAREIYDEILRYVGASAFASWYVGITNDIDERLFGYHKADRQFGAWYHAPAINAVHSRSVEAALLQLGFDGGGGGGDHSAVHVYAFRKDQGTIR